MAEYHSIPRINWGSFRGRRVEKWGSFRGQIGDHEGWGSFRGRDNFGGCTDLYDGNICEFLRPAGRSDSKAQDSEFHKQTFHGFWSEISVEDGCDARSDNITVVFVTVSLSIMVTRIALCNRLENDKRLSRLLLDKSLTSLLTMSYDFTK